MKITRRPTTGVPLLGDLAAQTGSQPAPVADGPAQGTDRVDLSEAARLRQRLLSETKDVAAIDNRRVAELRAQLANNTYHPAPRAVAERLLADLAADLLL